MVFNRVAIYVRVSTDIQVDGYSIDEQLERLEKYCEAREWIIYDKYIDPGFSGSNINRPAMLKMIKDIREGKIDLVLVYKLDRLSRSQKDTLYLIEEEFLPNGVDFISMSENFDTSTPFGRAMIGILSVFAQLERENIKTRLAMGHVGRAKAGYWHGGSNPPTGYDFINGELVINEYEALQIRLIFEKFLNGESFHSIARYMNEHYTNRYSSYSQASTISAIIKNNLYIGIIKYKGEEYRGAHTPIIDEETFNRAQERYKEISSKWNDHYRSPYHGKHLLTGLLFCGNCGARYFVYGSRSKNGKKLGTKYSYYKCYSRDGNKTMKKMDGCKNPNIRVEKLDRAVMDEIKKLKVDPDYLESLIQSSDNPKKIGERSEIRVIKKRIEEVEGRINKIMDLYTVGYIPLSDLGDRVKHLYEEKEKLEKSLENLSGAEEKEPERLTIEETREILDIYQDALDNADLPQKRRLAESLIDYIEVMPEKDTIRIHWKFT